MSLTLGLDSGSVAVGFVLLDEKGAVRKTGYRAHNGNPASCAASLLAESEVTGCLQVATVASAPGYIRSSARFDDTVCLASAAKNLHPDVRSLLVIGGERFGLISFDEDGEYRRMKTNTSCAAGTGSFLDQQARRLNLSGSGELSDLAEKGTGELPAIASRCSVFAKTDIIHAQQEGYGIEDICDGICHGLARNAADVLFDDGKVEVPAVFSGGVARNRRVTRHLERYLQTSFTADEYAHLYGALGAALCLQNAGGGSEINSSQIIRLSSGEKEYFFAPLELHHSVVPAFGEHVQYLYTGDGERKLRNPVEVDSYVTPAQGTSVRVVLGIDIGSTSTKAAVCSEEGDVLAGFYTRTAGRPVKAVMSVLEAADDWIEQSKAGVDIAGAATTGSGRKLSGAVVGADLIIDEITAHARAALELHPDVDTIIEIGGQDSKFTALKAGRVTFSKMNTVCAAGTGSFLEEQAARLDVKIEEYENVAMGSAAPLTSDRCTVFMERDINSFIHEDYSASEILAAAAHSVCENYLLKVASEGHIGSHIVFQGATAKNRALVAAFEQKLKDPIHVSRYCHLTGAVGAALALMDEPAAGTRFRGIRLYREEIPVSRERCNLCGNHCRLTIAEVHGERIAFGFLCGRDYDTKRFVSKNASGFDLLETRAGILKDAFRKSGTPAANTRGAGTVAGAGKSIRDAITIGIPAALHLSEEIPFWEAFFSALGFSVIHSAGYENAAASGKLIAGAEFCAPMAAFHGHAHYLSGKADVLFIPTYLENIHRNGQMPGMRKLCYYTQFAPVLVKTLIEQGDAGRLSRCAAPVFDPRLGREHMVRALRQSLEDATGEKVENEEVEQALYPAEEGRERAARAFHHEFEVRKPAQSGFDVVLLGRPYTVLNRPMNKGIPDIFGALGIRTYYQDMLPPSLRGEVCEDGPGELREDGPGELREELGAGPGQDGQIGELLKAVHWDYAARILEAAAACASTNELYPVLITSFKCAPDSFIIEYFTRIMDSHNKPYLILQLDEHASNVGYETRIEAAVRAFRNHHETTAGTERGKTASAARVFPDLSHEVNGRTMLFPNWDSIASPLVAANLKWAGWDVRVLEETQAHIREAMKYNTGQCIPAQIIAHECAEYVRKYRLDPQKTVLWMAQSQWACNIPMYPPFLKSTLETIGGGMEQVGLYVGTLLHTELPKAVVMRGYFAYLFAGLIRRLSCRIRPYEKKIGETDAAAQRALTLFKNAFLGESTLESALVETVNLFEGIEHDPEPRPKVAVFGDFYVRDNDVMNQDLVRCIEQAGGEVVTTPYNEYLRIVSPAYFKKWLKARRFGDLVRFKSMLALVDLIEKRYKRLFPDFLDDGRRPRHLTVEKELGQFNVSLSHEGESYENLLKIMHILKTHPDVTLFVQTNPAFCCPSLITEAMSAQIEKVTGVPVVSVTYDGTGALQNSVVVPYIHFAAERMR